MAKKSIPRIIKGKVDWKKLNPVEEYARALQDLQTEKQKRFVEIFLNDPDENLRGTAYPSAIKAGYSERYARKDVYRELPDPNMTRELSGNLKSVAKCIFWGREIQNGRVIELEDKRSAAIADLGLSHGWVMQRLKMISDIAMGLPVDPNTGMIDPKGKIDLTKFDPRMAEKATVSIGKDLGMFVKREIFKEKDYADKEDAELDETIEEIRTRLEELEKLERGEDTNYTPPAPKKRAKRR